MGKIFRNKQTGTYVISAPHRHKRPYSYGKTICPFDQGHEEMTPSSKLEVVTFEKPKEKWKVRVFENKFPALTITAKEKFEQNKEISGAYGCQEVIVETPLHGEVFEDFSNSQLQLVFEAYVNRFLALSKLKEIEYVFLGKNHGESAGASIAHEHSQIFALPFTPTNIKSEFSEKKCDICAISKKNVVFQNKEFVVVRPENARFQLECWIIPKKHCEEFVDFSEDTALTFMKTLAETVKKIKKGTKAYNWAFHVSGKKIKGHFHVEIYPKTENLAMLELGASAYINSMDAKTALTLLK